MGWAANNNPPPVFGAHVLHKPPPAGVEAPNRPQPVTGVEAPNEALPAALGAPNAPDAAVGATLNKPAPAEGAEGDVWNVPSDVPNNVPRVDGEAPEAL